MDEAMSISPEEEKRRQRANAQQEALIARANAEFQPPSEGFPVLAGDITASAVGLAKKAPSIIQVLRAKFNGDAAKVAQGIKQLESKGMVYGAKPAITTNTAPVQTAIKDSGLMDEKKADMLRRAAGK